MNMDCRFDIALSKSDALTALRELTKQLITEGIGQGELLTFFEVQRQRLRKADRVADEDAVVDAMDFITGWCSPHMKLFDSPIEIPNPK